MAERRSEACSKSRRQRPQDALVMSSVRLSRGLRARCSLHCEVDDSSALRLTRSTPAKGTKPAADTEAKAILECLLADATKVLYQPEWSIASLVIAVAVKVLASRC